MRASWVTRHGGPEELQAREAADPEPRPGEVRVQAASLGFAEIMARQGLPPDAPKPTFVPRGPRPWGWWTPWAPG